MSNAAVTEALAGLEPGTKVRLQLADGREVEGTLANHDADSVRLDDADEGSVDLDQVQDVLVEHSSDGIE